MENQEKDSTPKRRLKKKSGNFFSLFVILLAIALLGGYFLFFSESAQKFRSKTSNSISEEALDSPSAKDISAAVLNPSSQQNDLPPNNPAVNGMDNRAAMTNESSDIAPPGSILSASKETSSNLAGTTIDKECQKLADNIEQFFDTLDTRQYMEEFDLAEKSSVYFPKLIQKLVDNPPIVSGETDDLFTILQNTAHFFRIIGKRNIIILKGILDREKATFEQTLSDFFELTKRPECLKERFGLVIDKESLYQYAGFFINTMGGRLYLFRRDSMSRMVVGYYAILIIDQANREGRNKYGVEINSSIDRLINEIEASSIKLQMRDRYLDTLYSMKEKYQ